jgi:hypothetical protein
VLMSNPPQPVAPAEYPAAVEGARRALQAQLDAVMPLEQARGALRGRPIADCINADCAPQLAEALGVRVEGRRGGILAVLRRGGTRSRVSRAVEFLT